MSEVEFKAYQENITHLRMRTIGILYVTYALYYFPRKADSVAKSSLQEDMGFTVSDLALSDTAYLSTYTIMILAAGVFGSKITSNKLLAISLWSIAAISFLKSLVTSPYVYALLQSLHALFQCTGWPTCIKLLANWIEGDRGFIMGLWTTCQSLGGIVGAVGSTYALSTFSWRWAYYFHIPMLVAWGFVVLFFISDSPPSINVPVEDIEANTSLVKEDAVQPAPPRDQKQVTLKQVLKLPGVVLVAIAYFFLKFLRYALLFWLPYYYHDGLGYEKSLAGYVSTSFEFGGMVGTPFIGWLSDRYMNGKRDITAAAFMFGASIVLVFCNLSAAWGAFVNSISMFFIGILVIGPDSVLSGTIAQDIGNASGLGPSVVGTLAGLINSVGSCGSIFQSYATAIITAAFGWSTLFSVFVFCAIVSSSILFKVSFQNDEKLFHKVMDSRLRFLPVLLIVLYFFVPSASVKQP